MPDSIANTYSLLVPCYNATGYIDNFLHNVSTLNRPFDEVIFYDDASTDDTFDNLLTHGLRVIRGKENRGPGYARNRLAEAATCSHIHFHDIDDEFNPDFLGLVNSKFKEDDFDVVLGNADWIDAASREPLIKWRYTGGEMQQNPLVYFTTHPLGIINTAYKKSTFLQLNGFNEDIKCWEDADLHVRIAAAGASFGIVDEVLAYSIRHNNGISADQLRCWDCRLTFLKNYLDQYRGAIPDAVFTAELKRVQTMYIVAGKYKKLAAILSVNKQYKLSIKTTKMRLLYGAGLLLPAALINQALRLIRTLSSFKIT